MKYPSSMGGLTVGSYASHTIRGIDDKVSHWISIHFFLKKHYPEIYYHLQRFITDPTVGNISWQQFRSLIADPFSLRFRKLPNVMSYIRKTIRMKLGELSKNPEVKKFIDLAQNQSKAETLINDIMNLTPFMPTLGHELWRNSADGLIEHFITRLTAIATISKLVQHEGKNTIFSLDENLDNTIDNDLVDISLDVDFIERSQRYTEDIKKILRDKLENKLITCPEYIKVLTNTECARIAADELRLLHWGRSMVGISRPVSMEQGELRDVDTLTEEEMGRSIIMNIFVGLRKREDEHLTKVGPNSIYFGSSTAERISRPKMSVDNPSPITRAIQALHIIYTWAILMKSWNLRDLTIQLINEKIELIPESLKLLKLSSWCSTITGGHLLHRMHSSIEHDVAMINYSPNVSTYTFSDTTTIYPLVKQGSDFSIHFQMLIIYLQSIVLMMYYGGVEIPPQIALLLKCRTCTVCIDGVTVDLSKPPVYSNSMYSFEIERSVVNITVYIDPFIVQKYLSFTYGTIFGSNFDSIKESRYMDLTMYTGAAITYVNKDVSIADFRYVNFDVQLAGMIYQSRNLRKILEKPRIDLFHTNNRATQPFAQLLINSSRVNEFIRWTGFTGGTTNSITLSTGLASAILPAIQSLFHKNPMKHISNVLKFRFVESDEFNMDHFIIWAIRFACCLNHREEELPTIMADYNFMKDILNDRQKAGIAIMNASFQTKIREYQSIKVTKDLIQSLWRSKMSSGIMMDCYDLEKINSLKLHIQQADYINVLRLFVESYFTNIHVMDRTDHNSLPPDVYLSSRFVGSISTAATKLAEIMSVCEYDSNQDHVIMSLAEGNGSFIHWFMHNYHPAKFI